MKAYKLIIQSLAFLLLATVAATAAELASAKVVGITGSVTKTSPDGQATQLTPGAILKEGDSLAVDQLSEAKLVFSNGSEVTVKERSNISLAKLHQEAFTGNQSYEQLQADPSKSQTLLELNYGSVDFNVKKLQSGSTFDIATAMGTAAIRGTSGTVTILYNRVRNEFTLLVTNLDGVVDINSTYVGSLIFGSGNTAATSFSSNVGRKIENIPGGHTVILRVSAGDPDFREVYNALLPFFPPSQPKPVITPTPPPGASGNEDDDLGIIVVSPEGPSSPPVPQ
ncbi:MAG: FecR domain-containing protein [Opitutales bacterium]